MYVKGLQKGDWVKNKVDRKKLEQLTTALEVIQTDFDTVTAKEKTGILIKASVFDEKYAAVGYISQDLVEKHRLNQQEVAKTGKLF